MATTTTTTSFPKVKTPGGVPLRPNIDLKLVKKEPDITMDIEWTRPVETYGELKGYRVRYGHRGQKLTEILVRGSILV